MAEAHLDDADREVRNMASALFIHFERLFMFLEEEGVEPTNNAVEQALRTLPTRYAAIATELQRLLCSRSGPDHVGKTGSALRLNGRPDARQEFWGW